MLMLIISGCAWQQKNIERKGFSMSSWHLHDVEPTNLELYRALLPAPLEMPDQPVVSMFIVDYTEVYPWPMTPYQEGALFLRSNIRDRRAGIGKTMPVTNGSE